MNITKFYNKAYDWLIRFGPRFVIGLLVLFIGLWLTKLLLNRSHKGMHRKEVDPTLKSFLTSLLGVVLRVLLILGVMSSVSRCLCLRPWSVPSAWRWAWRFPVRCRTLPAGS